MKMVRAEVQPGAQDPGASDASWFHTHDGPTWLVAAAIYGGWAAIVWFHASLPWWVVAPVGGYLVAWHFSLQHEAIHAFRSAPRWLRWTVVMPPIGLWLPFPLYYQSHRKHHQNTHLTEPRVDTESVYWRQDDWARMSPLARAILMANQTLAGRVLLGPCIRLVRLVARETALVRAGDFSHLPHWTVHVVLVGLLFSYISGIAGMPWWQYVLLVAWPAFMYGWVRPFVEHSYGPPIGVGRNADGDAPLDQARPGERTAIIESNRFWGWLFLYNNYHAVHHLHPTIPWFEIPAFYRVHRAKILAHNGGYWLPGYLEVARRWLFKPVFPPVHPRW
jgi:fatty acid desaturase